MKDVSLGKTAGGRWITSVNFHLHVDTKDKEIRKYSIKGTFYNIQREQDDLYFICLSVYLLLLLSGANTGSEKVLVAQSEVLMLWEQKQADFFFLENEVLFISQKIKSFCEFTV